MPQLHQVVLFVAAENVFYSVINNEKVIVFKILMYIYFYFFKVIIIIIFLQSYVAIIKGG